MGEQMELHDGRKHQSGGFFVGIKSFIEIKWMWERGEQSRASKDEKMWCEAEKKRLLKGERPNSSVQNADSLLTVMYSQLSCSCMLLLC